MLGDVTRDANVSGVRIRVAERGSGDPVILLHGLLFDSRTWTGVSRRLTDRFRLIAPDLPGFGQSEKPRQARFGYDIAAYTETITDLYAGLDLGRAAVVGHGLGGAIALSLAAKRPELVSRLVLVDTMCYPTRVGLRERLASTPLLGGLVFKQLIGRRAFSTLLDHSLFPSRSRLPRERLNDYYLAFNAPAARDSALLALRETLDTSGLVAHTRRIQTPTLIVWGRHDSLYPAAHGQRLAKEIPGAGFQLMDTGHCPQEEAPDELGQVIRAFLSNQRSTATKQTT
jgi:pimeloyl-ACP methyl ester carboxylesterase